MKNRLRIGACLLLLLLLPGIVAAQNKPDELAQKLDAFFAEHAEETVGVSMSVLWESPLRPSLCWVWC